MTLISRAGAMSKHIPNEVETFDPISKLRKSESYIWQAKLCVGSKRYCSIQQTPTVQRAHSAKYTR